MDLLVHAVAGSPMSPEGLAITGDASTFDRLVRALH